MDSKNKLGISSYFKKRNAKRFSIFIGIAFLFLIFSKLSNDYKQSLYLKIDINNIEDEVMLQKDSSNFLIAYVEAKGFALVPLLFKKSKTIVVDAEIDVYNSSKHYVFDVQKHKYIIEEQLGSSYNIISLKPDTLIMSYSRRASKNVPVVLNKKLDFIAGFDIKGNFTLEVDSVKLVGPAKAIDTIKFIPTEVLSLKRINSDINETVDFISMEGVEIIPDQLKVKADVRRFTEGKIEVPITVVNQPQGVKINYFPKTVSIYYYVDLESYKLIDASDFSVECSYNDILNGKTYFSPKITKKPNFVERVIMKQKRIDFIKL